jgi:hypothetical protein
MRYLALVALCCSMTTLCLGQTPSGPSAKPQCRLTPEQAPEIRGVRLGMSMEKLMAAFPEDANRTTIETAVKNSKRSDNYGFSGGTLYPGNGGANEKFAGVIAIGVEILDERVSFFQVSYRGPEWEDVDQFIAKLSDAFHLPKAELWKPAAAETKSLACNGFEIRAYTGESSNAVLVRSSAAAEVVNDRREAAREKERRAFKP